MIAYSKNELFILWVLLSIVIFNSSCSNKKFIQIKDQSNTSVIAEGYIIKDKSSDCTTRFIQYKKVGDADITSKTVNLHHRIGPWKYYYKDGSLAHEVEHNGAHKLDKVITFNPDTYQEEVQEVCTHDVKGDEIFYNTNGKIQMKRSSKENGQLLSEVSFGTDGSIQREKTISYDGDNPLEIINDWNNEIRRKVFKYEEGNCISETNYLDDKEVYRLVHEYKDGRKHKTQRIKDEKVISKSNYVYIQGKLDAIVTYSSETNKTTVEKQY